MKLTIFNGSPKKGENNTAVLIEKFTEGFMQTAGNDFRICKLNKLKSMNEAVKLFEKSECVLLAFPLYNYSMPAGVKEFIESLETLIKKKKNIKIGFMIQYGFPEAIHARGLEKYLVRLCERMNLEYLGTIIKGGCNNLADEDEYHAKLSGKNKIIDMIRAIGKKFGEDGVLDKKLLDKFSKPEKSSFIVKLIMKLMIRSINKNYWQTELEKNGVTIEKSFARPYEE